MKKLFITAVLALLVSPFINAQVDRPPVEKFDEFVLEVYAGDGIEQMQPNSLRYAYMKKMYNERITYRQIPESVINEKEYPLLSSVPLYTTYNENLMRDISFDKNNFNPLKYDFGVYEKYAQSFVVDGTTTVITIMPQIVRQNN